MSTQQDIKGRDEVAELYRKYNLRMGKDIYKNEKQNYIIVTRTGIEIIQAVDKIMVDFEVVSISHDYCAIKAIAYRKADKSDKIETFGSAKLGQYVEIEAKTKDGRSYKKNKLEGGSTDSFYIIEMAEKRALSRAVLKICGFYKHHVFGEDENMDLTQEAKESSPSSAGTKASSAINQVLKK